MSRSLRIVAIATLLSCAGREAAQTSDSTATTNTAAARANAIDSGAPRLEPRDEASASFREFRERTLPALARRDTAFLFSIVSPDIKTSFGPDGGLRDFKETWKTADSASMVWATLSRVLRMGGKHSSDSMFFAPYVYAFWPDSIDAFSHVAVTSANASVHVRAERQSEVLGTATYSILRALEWSGIPGDAVASDTSWVRVESPDKRSGWIAVGDVYSPVSWRAAFVRLGERWVMILFVAGD